MEEFEVKVRFRCANGKYVTRTFYYYESELPKVFEHYSTFTFIKVRRKHA